VLTLTFTHLARMARRVEMARTPTWEIGKDKSVGVQSFASHTVFFRRAG
jgi:hypothetical protein